MRYRLEAWIRERQVADPASMLLVDGMRLTAEQVARRLDCTPAEARAAHKAVRKRTRNVTFPKLAAALRGEP